MILKKCILPHLVVSDPCILLYFKSVAIFQLWLAKKVAQIQYFSYPNKFLPSAVYFNTGRFRLIRF